jgi:hypothetical protein
VLRATRADRVCKLRLIVNKIVSSPQRCQHFQRCAEKQYGSGTTSKDVKIATLMPVRDVVTRWNYTHAMIKRALLLKKVRFTVTSSFVLAW